MRLFIDEGIEQRVDRAVNLAIAIIVAVSLVGFFVVDGRVPIQFSNEGWVSYMPKAVASIAYPLGAFLASTLRRSIFPFVRWLGRVAVFFFMFVGVLAFNHAF